MQTTHGEAAQPSQVLKLYAALEYASEEMLQAARLGDWDVVCRLEGACGVVIARLRDIMAHETFKPSEQDERVRILRSIIANDAEIRRIAHPGAIVADNSLHDPLFGASATLH